MQVPIVFRSTFLSFVCFFLWLPFLLYSVSALFPHRQWKKRVGVGYLLLSLISLVYGTIVPSPFIAWFGKLAEPSKVVLTWWPKAFTSLPTIPYEGILFSVLGVLGYLFIRSGFEKPRFYYFVWGAILLQTIFHLSLHSPYSYLPHFEQPSTANYWYHAYLFPENRGAVNEDYFWFWQSEALFLGSSGKLSVFWSRLLPHYLSSRLSVVLHPIYAWIFLSTFFWLLSVRAVYSISVRYLDEKGAAIVALLQASSPALITYVGQAKPYALAFCLIPILLSIFFYLLKDQYRRFYSAIGFGLCLGSTLLCYEMQPWLIVLPIWSRFLKIKWGDIFLFSLVGIGVYVGFGSMSVVIPELVLKDTFQAGYGSPLENAIRLLTSFDLGKIWATLHYSLKSFWVLTFHAFSTVLPLAIIGIFLVWRNKAMPRDFLFLLLPGLMACLLIGVTNQSLYFQYPRIVFGNYIGMMGLASVALIYLGNRFSPTLPFFLLGLNALYWNLDVWGHPAIYFHWFYRFPSFANWF